ncbi:2-phosphosulfolactate phosphatase [Pseudomonas sp.]|uniref:2-phosphosulfolactate phosphatase n=1 Tax=Pseudomonas sp. TaxID=306 RepID=UPI0026099E37|nr:2-phosphosulfolactate phosphatase [Pseudomonas sp.]
MPKVTVVLRQEDLDALNLAEKTVVIINVLSTTSLIAQRLADGANEVHLLRPHQLPGPLLDNSPPMNLMQGGACGTALRKSSEALHVYTAALVNAPAVVQRIAAAHDSPIVLVCAGSDGQTNLLDIFTAGYICCELLALEPLRWQLSDSAIVAQAVHNQFRDSPWDCLLSSQTGRALGDTQAQISAKNLTQIGTLDVVPTLVGNCLRA